MKNKINQDELMLKLLVLSLQEQEDEVNSLKKTIGMLKNENKILSKKREHLLKDKLDLQNKLKRYDGILKKSILQLRDTKFIKFPLRKYYAYKKMLDIFHHTIK